MRAKPCWFCKNYGKYTERNIADEFDQHFLLASIAPRFVMVGSCDGDPWADPISQQLCALAASEAWEELSLPGILECEEYFEPGSFTDEGRVGFFKLHSKHFLSRHSWKRFLSFVEKHRNEKV